MDEGAQIVEEFLNSWTTSLANTAASGDDVEMEDGDGDEKMLYLKKSYSIYKDRIEANPWCKEVLASL